MFRATLHFQDGAALTLPVADGETVVEAALNAELPLRSDCMSGSCGSCIARCTAGDVSRDAMDQPIVDADEIVAGIYPTCLTRLLSDAHFELDYPLAPQPSPAGRQRGRLVRIDRLATTISRLIISTLR